MPGPGIGVGQLGESPHDVIDGVGPSVRRAQPCQRRVDMSVAMRALWWEWCGSHLVNLKLAVYGVVPSLSITCSVPHLPAQAFSVFQT